MSRLSFALVLLVGLLGGGLGATLLRPMPETLSDSEVRGIITDMLTRHDADHPVQSAEIDPGKLNTIIENYLMSDPAILDRMNGKLAEVKRVAERKAEKDAIAAHFDAIYDADGNVVLGNPKGDVTLVEMFDYNCTYCRGAVPDMATLLADDPNLRVILKEFPILSEGSVDAARIAVLVSKDPAINYWDFHQKLFSVRGQVGADQALAVAADLGANRGALMLDMNGKEPEDVIQANYDLARALNVGGTPTYILGDEMIPGAIGVDSLRQKIANLRACGSTECTGTDAAGPVDLPLEQSPAG
jgi:protein-disulfide isomerase